MSEPLRVVPILHLALEPGLGPTQADQAWKSTFEPLIGALHHTPEVRVALVLNGELIEEFKERRPQALDWLRALVDRGQVELLATALYEPVISAVPERDAVGQFQTHATQVKKLFGVRPRGAWLPHHIWDPCLPRVLAAADLGWVVLDERLLGAETPPGVPRTEREGHAVAVLAADGEVPQLVLSATVKQVLTHLVRRGRRGHRLIPLALEAARFSGPQAQSWLATLLTALTRSPKVIETRLPHEAVEAGPRGPRLYIPQGGPAAQQGPWERQLLARPEAERLHQRMLRVSRLVERQERATREGTSDGHRPDPALLLQARRYLYRSQAASFYGADPHGGVLDPVRRAVAWRDLLRAERVALEALGVQDRFSVELADLDCDGQDEVMLRSPAGVLIIEPDHDGGVGELSLARPPRNLFDVATRQLEPWHRELLRAAVEPPPIQATEDEVTAALRTPPEALVEGIARDDGPRVAFLERWLGQDVTLEQLRTGRFNQVAWGQRGEPWQVVSAEHHGDDAVRALLLVDETVEASGEERRVRLHKRYTWHEEAVLDFRLEVLNRDHQVLRGRLAVQIDLAVGVAGTAAWVVAGGERRSGSECGDSGEVQEIRIESSELVLHLFLRKPGRLWHYPVDTVHRVDGKPVRVHQGVCLVLSWPVELWGQEKARFDVRLAVEA